MNEPNDQEAQKVPGLFNWQGIRQCSICHGPLEPDPEKAKIWDQGNNAQPINQGRCCDLCNQRVVLPARLRRRALGLPIYG